MVRDGKVNPLVTIVIPVFNGSNFLAEAINSALKQTYKNVEVIVVNDGSNDGGRTREVCERYLERIRYFEKPNGGVASALNFAIQRASGEFVSWLSHDDLYLPPKLEAQVEYWRTLGDESAVVYSDYGLFGEDSGKVVNIRLPSRDPKLFRYWLTVESSLHGCSLLIPRRIIREEGGFDESLRYTQDYDLWFKMGSRCRFYHLGQVTTLGRQHPGQDSVAKGRAAKRESNDLVIKFLKNLTEAEIVEGTGLAGAVGVYEIALRQFARGFDKAGLFAFWYSFSVAMRKPRSNLIPWLRAVTQSMGSLAKIFFQRLSIVK